MTSRMDRIEKHMAVINEEMGDMRDRMIAIETTLKNIKYIAALAIPLTALLVKLLGVV